MSLINYPESVDPQLLDILTVIMRNSDYSDFGLAGGTSLSLRFGHRKSVDLDFFTANPFDSSSLQSSLFRDFSNSQILNQTAGSICISIEGIKADFLFHPFPLLNPIERELPYRFLSLEDIAAMKINAVTNRGAKKDFIDLYVLSELGLSLSTAVEFYEQKYNGNRFLAVKSLQWFNDAEEDPDPIMIIEKDWKAIRSIMEEKGKSLI